jgi:hypothetical protein
MKALYQLLKEEQGPRTHITLRLSSVPGQMELDMYTNDGAYTSFPLDVDEMDNPEYIKHVAECTRLTLQHLREVKEP